MKKCKTCKYWKYQDTDKEIYFRDGTIIGPRSGVIYRLHRLILAKISPLTPQVKYCMSPKLLFYMCPGSTQAAILDQEQCWGELIASEDFGCVNHEKK